MPSDLRAVKVVCSWLEPAASSGASQARKSDVRVWVDVPPYSAGGNTGDYQILSLVDNTIWRLSNTGQGSMADNIKGKTVRFKVYGQSISGGAAKFGLVVLAFTKHQAIKRGTYHCLEPGQLIDVEVIAALPLALFILVSALQANLGQVGDFTVGKPHLVLPDTGPD